MYVVSHQFLATRAVLLSGLSVIAWSNSTRTFHVPKKSGVTFTDFLDLLLPLWRDPISHGMLARVMVRQARFKASFLTLSPCYGGEQCCSK